VQQQLTSQILFYEFDDRALPSGRPERRELIRLIQLASAEGKNAKDARQFVYSLSIQHMFALMGLKDTGVGSRPRNVLPVEKLSTWVKHLYDYSLRVLVLGAKTHPEILNLGLLDGFPSSPFWLQHMFINKCLLPIAKALPPDGDVMERILRPILGTVFVSVLEVLDRAWKERATGRDNNSEETNLEAEILEDSALRQLGSTFFNLTNTLLIPADEKGATQINKKRKSKHRRQNKKNNQKPPPTREERVFRSLLQNPGIRKALFNGVVAGMAWPDTTTATRACNLGARFARLVAGAPEFRQDCETVLRASLMRLKDFAPPMDIVSRHLAEVIERTCVVAAKANQDWPFATLTSLLADRGEQNLEPDVRSLANLCRRPNPQERHLRQGFRTFIEKHVMVQKKVALSGGLGMDCVN